MGDVKINVVCFWKLSPDSQRIKIKEREREKKRQTLATIQLKVTPRGCHCWPSPAITTPSVLRISSVCESGKLAEPTSSVASICCNVNTDDAGERFGSVTASMFNARHKTTAQTRFVLRNLCRRIMPAACYPVQWSTVCGDTVRY